jgi:hypothetical protein
VDRRQSAVLDFNVAWTTMCGGDLEAALVGLDAAADLTRECGQTALHHWTRAVAGAVRAALGLWDDAVDELESAAAAAEDEALAPRIVLVHAVVVCRAGQPELARAGHRARSAALLAIPESDMDAILDPSATPALATVGPARHLRQLVDIVVRAPGPISSRTRR